MKYARTLTVVTALVSLLTWFGVATATGKDEQSIIVPCAANQGCTGTVNNVNTSGTVTATPGSTSTSAGSLTMTLDGGPALSCPGYTPQSLHWVAFNLSVANDTKTMSLTLAKPTTGTPTSALIALRMCFGSPVQFTTKEGIPATPTTLPDGSTEFVGLLPECQKIQSSGPCVTGKTIDQPAETLTIKGFIPSTFPGDPRFRG